MSMINVPISVGELLDKITILQIKSKAIKDNNQLKNIQRELRELEDVRDRYVPHNDELLELFNKLGEVNQKLWNIEDDIRVCEKNKLFEDKFIQLARSVYFTNDIRANIKKEMNLLTGSELVEEKSYEDYT